MRRLLALTLLAAAAGAAHAQRFTALPTDIGIGYFPAMDVADLDGDGRLDLVVCGGLERSGASTQLLLGDGRGGFARVSDAPFVDVQEGDVALADIDGDGDVDVLLTGDRGQELGPARWVTRLYRNDGRGGFAEAATQPFRDVSSGAVAFADVDGDGDADALVAGGISGTGGAALYLNDGQGVFTEVTTNNFKNPFQATLAFADLDGDRDRDLIIGGTTWPQAAQVYRNDGGGNFITYPQVGYTGVSFSAMAVGDLDGDGDADALFTGEDGGTSAVMTRLYLNDGAADFSPAFPQPFPDMSLGGICLTDVDLDGDLDVILTGRRAPAPGRIEPTTTLYLNDGKATFAAAPVQPFAPLYLSEVIARDIDGDGDEDIILAGTTLAGTYTTVVYRNDAIVVGTRDGATAAGPALRAWPNPVAAGATVTLAYEAPAAEDVSVVVFDAGGRRVRTQVFAAVAGEQTVAVSTAGLAAGVYRVLVGGRVAEVVVAQ